VRRRQTPSQALSQPKPHLISLRYLSLFSAPLLWTRFHSTPHRCSPLHSIPRLPTFVHLPPFCSQFDPPASVFPHFTSPPVIFCPIHVHSLSPFFIAISSLPPRQYLMDPSHFHLPFSSLHHHSFDFPSLQFNQHQFTVHSTQFQLVGVFSSSHGHEPTDAPPNTHTHTHMQNSPGIRVCFRSAFLTYGEMGPPPSDVRANHHRQKSRRCPRTETQTPPQQCPACTHSIINWSR
jgi:hypothetical protein